MPVQAPTPEDVLAVIDEARAGGVGVDYGHLHIQDKRDEIVPLRLNRAQQHFDENMTGRDLILKARQHGFSTFVQAWQFLQAAFDGKRFVTLAHDDESTQKLRRMSKLFHEGLANPPGRSQDNATQTSYAGGGGVTIATAGSKHRGRGSTFGGGVHGSEVAFWPDPDATIKGVLQGVPLGAPIIFESTPNGAQGWFFEQCMAALDGDSDWTLHFYPWWWAEEYRIPLEPGEVIEYTDDELAAIDLAAQGGFELGPEQIKFRRAKQRELGTDFKQEYAEDPLTCFLTSGNSFFGDIEHVYTAPLNALPQVGEHYVIGLDFGQDYDFTVGFVLNKMTLQQVDLLRINRLRWQDMRIRISELAHKWNNAKVIGEANSMGKTNIEMLKSGEYLADGTQIKPVRLTMFETTAQSKPPLIQGLYHALHELGMTMQKRPEQRQEFRQFVSRQTPRGHWQYEAEAGHDDIVIAAALAVHGAHRSSSVTKVRARMRR